MVLIANYQRKNLFNQFHISTLLVYNKQKSCDICRDCAGTAELCAMQGRVKMTFLAYL